MENLEKVVLIRYGEIHLKGKNRGIFEMMLENNIKNSLRDIECKFSRIGGRYTISGYSDKNQKKIMSALMKVSGIHSFSPAYVVSTSEENIVGAAVSLMRDLNGSFRVSTKRADKTFAVSSMPFSAELGGHILDSNSNLKVDLHNPDYELSVDIRENKKTYLFFENVMGIGGMPVGSSGNGLLLLSGGIDSPVAGYMMSKRGVKISALHFESFPYTSAQAKQKVFELAEVLSSYNGGIDVYVCNVAEIQDEIHQNCDGDYMITLLRRFMLRIAEKIANENRLQSLISGDSLAQVASQTMESITTISQAIASSDLPFFRPLIAFDKIDTINISKKIGTYEISIRPFDDCCTVFLPKTPVIKPKIQKVLKEEKRLNVEELLERAYKSIEKISL